MARTWSQVADVPAAASAAGMWSGASPDPRRRIVTDQRSPEAPSRLSGEVQRGGVRCLDERFVMRLTLNHA